MFVRQVVRHAGMLDPVAVFEGTISDCSWNGGSCHESDLGGLALLTGRQ